MNLFTHTQNIDELYCRMLYVLEIEQMFVVKGKYFIY